jgi:hypothetical protein
MGDVIAFANRHGASVHRVDGGGPTATADVVLFTGVRIERWVDWPSEVGDEPALSDPQPPRGRRRRARPGP